MVDIHTNSTTIASLHLIVISALQQTLDRQITARQLAQVAEDQQWELLEGQYRNDLSANANHLREILSDIVAQWESCSPESLEEYPAEWVHHWLKQLHEFPVPTSSL